MSKHIPRTERWWEVSRTKFLSPFGYVEMNPRGKWDAMVVCQEREKPHRKGQPMKELSPAEQWRTIKRHCGEFRRSREAMMAVEEKIESLRREKSSDRII
jgi:hypothetical protein